MKCSDATSINRVMHKWKSNRVMQQIYKHCEEDCSKYVEEYISDYQSLRFLISTDSTDYRGGAFSKVLSYYYWNSYAVGNNTCRRQRLEKTYRSVRALQNNCDHETDEDTQKRILKGGEHLFEVSIFFERSKD